MRVAKSLLAFVCSVTMFGQQIDYNTQIRNKPPTTVYDARVYNFAALTPGVPLTASVPATVTLAPAPAGVVAGDTNETFYLSGGTGSPEAVSLQSGGTCLGTGQTTCTVTFTPANSHTGAWTITAASAGTQEAIATACSLGGGTVYLHAGNIRTYDTITIPCSIRLTGDGPGSTLINAQSNTFGVILVNNASPVVLDHFQIYSATQQTSAAYGIELTAPSTGSNTNSVIDDIWVQNAYVGVLGLNADGPIITRSVFLNFVHAGVVIDDGNTQDTGGDHITNCVFTNFSGPAVADAAILIKSTGGIVISNNGINGGSTGTTNLLNMGVHLTALVSSGLLIDANDIENTGLAAIDIAGTYALVTITNNHLVQFSGIPFDPSVWWGVIISNGTGSGVTQGVISNNVINGIGSGSTNVGMVIQGGSADWMISSNQVQNVGVGFNVSAASNVVIGPEQIANSGASFSVLTSTTTLNNPFPIAFAALPGVADGSSVFCPDCNSTCTAGSSTGQMCNHINGNWQH